MRKRKKNDDTQDFSDDINEYYDTDKLINIDGDPIDPEDIKKAEIRLRKKEDEENESEYEIKRPI